MKESGLDCEIKVKVEIGVGRAGGVGGVGGRKMVKKIYIKTERKKEKIY